METNKQKKKRNGISLKHENIETHLFSLVIKVSHFDEAFQRKELKRLLLLGKYLN